MSPELPEALRVALSVIDVLDELRVRYHVGGSYASSIHGIPRQTQGIDLVVDLPPEGAGPLASKLGDEFYVDEESVRRAARDKSSVNVITWNPESRSIFSSAAIPRSISKSSGATAAS